MIKTYLAKNNREPFLIKVNKRSKVAYSWFTICKINFHVGMKDKISSYLGLLCLVNCVYESFIFSEAFKTHTIIRA